MFRNAVSSLFALVIFPAFLTAPTIAADAPPPPGQDNRQHLQKGDFLTICGDSITEQKLYSLFMEEYLLMCKPQQDLRVMQFGWNGDTSWGFLKKMPGEVMRYDPTVVTICFGMNDGQYCYAEPDHARYRKCLTSIVENFKKDGARFIVLAAPGVVDTQTFWGGVELAARYNPVLAKERDIAREVAQQQGIVFANIHDVLNDVMTRAKAKHGKNYGVCGQEDGVHPDENGHLVMAYVMLKALGCDGNIGTITLDAATGQAHATDGHKVLAATRHSVQVESSRYPFCFFGDPASPKATRGIIEFIPFNDELNRFRLVVRGVAGKSVKVTWGTATKEFSGAQLEQGINLAAEFLDNPFSAQFLEVEKAMRIQQNYETPLVKRVLHELADIEQYVTEESAAIETIKQAAQKKAKHLFDQAAASVKPVTHTLTIDAR